MRVTDKGTRKTHRNNFSGLGLSFWSRSTRKIHPDMVRVHSRGNGPQSVRIEDGRIPWNFWGV